MALIPKNDPIKDALEKGNVAQEFRTYIGMSGIGGTCARKIWYDFHWAYNRLITKRLQRIFERGDMEEARIIKDLEAVGMVVSDDQKEIIDSTGHIKGHIDGIVKNVIGAPKTPHLFEAKTMNTKRFAEYLKKGLKSTNPSYWGQIHTYMGELGLTRCLFCVTNKDTEEREYARYNYDKEEHAICMEKGFGILTSEKPPKKIGEATWFACKFCDAKDVCHKGKKIRKGCRTCAYADIEMEGEWSCSNPKWTQIHEDGLDDPCSNTLTKDRQLIGCPSYVISDVF